MYDKNEESRHVSLVRRCFIWNDEYDNFPLNINGFARYLTFITTPRKRATVAIAQVQMREKRPEQLVRAIESEASQPKGNSCLRKRL